MSWSRGDDPISLTGRAVPVPRLDGFRFRPEPGAFHIKVSILVESMALETV